MMTKISMHIDNSEAQVIRCRANKDFQIKDETSNETKNIKEGQIFYWARSSKNDGTYYLVVWSYINVRWDCQCPATTDSCRHTKAVVDNGHSFTHSLQGYKPADKVIAQAERIVKDAHSAIMAARLNNNREFSLLKR